VNSFARFAPPLRTISGQTTVQIRHFMVQASTSSRYQVKKTRFTRRVQQILPQDIFLLNRVPWPCAPLILSVNVTKSPHLFRSPFPLLLDD